MDDYKLMLLLADVFKYANKDKIEELEKFLTDDCKYESEYSNKTFDNKKEILAKIKKVNSNLNDDQSYDYKVIKLDEILDKEKYEAFCKSDVNDYAILLYQFIPKKLVAVVTVNKDNSNKMTKIHFSTDFEFFNVKDFLEIEDKTYDYDYNTYEYELKSFLNVTMGYSILDKNVFEDSTGFKVRKDGKEYIMYVFNCKKDSDIKFDVEWCMKVLDYEFSKDHEVLIIYLQMKKVIRDGKDKYIFTHYSGRSDLNIETFRLTKINDKDVFQFYPNELTLEMIDKFIYTFNNESLDACRVIFPNKDPQINEYDSNGGFLNSAFYYRLSKLKRTYGKLKVGYMSYDGKVYSKVPYLENYGFFSFKVNHNPKTIDYLKTHAFNDEIKDFIKVDDRLFEKAFSYVPKLIKIEKLDAVHVERFAFKLIYDNGDVRKYALPFLEKYNTNSNEEVISYNGFVFTDKIWESAKIVEGHQSEYDEYPSYDLGIEFSNGYFISNIESYEHSEEYSQPQICNETIFENDEIKFVKKWKWSIKSVYQSDEKGILKCLISGNAFNYDGNSTFVGVDGKRLTTLEFDYIDDFEEGFSIVGIKNEGYALIDKDMNFLTNVNCFDTRYICENKFIYKSDNKWNIFDVRNKSKIVLEKEYEEVCDYSDGLCRVSTLNLDWLDLVYHCEHPNNIGIFGYIDETGKEIIEPKYIYAFDFCNGVALVCKGKWKYDKWGESETKGYWTDEELWGMIDKEGNEVIPCIFDEIKYLDEDTNEKYFAHFGGYPNGKWGVIDVRGNWIVEPIFNYVSHGINKDLIVFSNDEFEDCYGIYDITNNKVLFEPQFFDVNEFKDGYIQVEVYDEKLDMHIEKVIDREGNEKFKSSYSSILGEKRTKDNKKVYEVSKRVDGRFERGFIDEDGNELVMIHKDVSCNGILYDKELVIFEENSKKGICDFNENVIIESKYLDIRLMRDNNPYNLLIIKDKNDKKGIITLDEKIIISPIYDEIKCCEDNFFIVEDKNGVEFIELIYKEAKDRKE